MTGRRLIEDAALNKSRRTLRCEVDADLQIAARRVLRGEDHIWGVIRHHDEQGAWTVADIDADTNCRGRQVARYVSNLVKAGIAAPMTRDLIERAASTPVVYRLVKRPAETPRVRPDGTPIGPSRQQCMWNAMRTLKTGFTVRELAYASSTPEQKVKETAAQRYIELLAGAGYLLRVQERKGRTGLHVWRLKPSMNTGPLSPALYNVTAIYDRNTKVVIGEPTYEAAA